jgi:hypothetical protein
MGTLSTLAAVVAVPVGIAVIGVAVYDARSRLSAAVRPRGGVRAADRSLERLVADLRRLEREQLDVRRDEPPAAAARLRALSLAYDDTLRDLCRALDLPEPGRPPLTPQARLRTEAALTARGVRW